ncbi:MAG: hypothetical protein ACOZJZ_10715 [Pseudomonadota bacterium]
MGMKLLGAAAALAVPLLAAALTIEEDDASKGKVIQRGKVTVVALGGDEYSLTDVPVQAVQFEFFEQVPEKYRDAAAGLNTGEPVTKEQALAVLDADYRDSAFDYDSVRLRGLAVQRRGFVAWCSNISLFGCLNRELRAGTWVEFEANGRNRQGGMTGYQRRIVMIRRVPGAPAASASSPAPGPTSVEAPKTATGG